MDGGQLPLHTLSICLTPGLNRSLSALLVNHKSHSSLAAETALANRWFILERGHQSTGRRAETEEARATGLFVYFILSGVVVIAFVHL